MSELSPVQDGIRQLYVPTVNAIVDALGQGDMCIVAGPLVSGKSKSLLPLLAERLNGDGRPTVVADCQRYYDGAISDSFEAPLVNNGVALLDEAGVPNMLRRKEEMYKLFRDTGHTAIVSVIAHPIELDPSSTIEQWKQLSSNPNEVPVVRLTPMQLPGTLALQYLKAHDADPKAIEFMMSLPPYLAIFSLVQRWDLRSLPNTVTALKHNLISRQGSIPPEELKRLQALVDTRAFGLEDED